MLPLRKTNPLLAKKTDKELRAYVEAKVYESSVFEGARLPKDYSLSARTKASAKNSVKASYSSS